MLDEIIERLSSPEKFSIFLFTLGFCLIVAATGIIGELKFLGLSAPTPRSIREKFLMGGAGVLLAIGAVALSLAMPVYKPATSAKRIYAGNDVKQIVADGEDLYLLKDNGNIYRISDNRLQLVDPGTETAQISPAGGGLYILKEKGNIWNYVSVSGRTLKGEDSFLPKDDGTRTKQVVSAGAALYILKESGNIWQYYARPVEGNMSAAQEEYICLDNGTNTKQIVSTGSILYVLKQNGDIWQYIPTHAKLFGRIYQAENDDKRAAFMTAAGGALYYIRSDGSTWRYKDWPPQLLEKENANEIDALGAILYILTKKGEIIRYNAYNHDFRTLSEAGHDNLHIAAFGQDVFVIKQEGKGVWRYNEYIRNR